ncbi:GPW/gp25 family protein [Silvimonas sp.]|uniref:GPW/gp25 family protein n=1 Tax=Silvimonas sp. TaxID=2650811 RepID=UPI00285133F3|nr:GPW/gp25 family protein [Silvimonas sp.]MDR3429685.1 GPW/gp25 family protein [Silvimonas sp.]
MNAKTGAAMSDLASITQSVADILATPLNTRVMRRDYGSLVPDLIDAPVNTVTLQLLRAASVMAILRWEKRLSPTRISFEAGEKTGALVVSLEAERIDGNRRDPVSLAIPLRGGT